MPSTMDTVKLWYNKNGKPLAQIVVPEAASQSFKRGDLVYRASGKATLVTLSTLEYTDAQSAALGIAEMDASGVTDTPIVISVIDGDFRWVLPVTNTAADAVTAVANGGAKFPLQRTSAGQWAVNTQGNSNPVVIQESIHGQYPVGETHGWVVAKFLVAETEELG